MSGGPEIRPLARAHLPALLALEARLFGADGWPRLMFLASLSPSFRSRVAISGGAVIGFARFGAGRLDKVLVRPEDQRRGVGSALLADVLAAGPVTLEVAAGNPAWEFYARRGFVVTARLPGYYQPSGTDAFVMVRTGSGTPW